MLHRPLAGLLRQVQDIFNDEDATAGDESEDAVYYAKLAASNGSSSGC